MRLDVRAIKAAVDPLRGASIPKHLRPLANVERDARGARPHPSPQSGPIEIYRELIRQRDGHGDDEKSGSGSQGVDPLFAKLSQSGTSADDAVEQYAHLLLRRLLATCSGLGLPQGVLEEIVRFVAPDPASSAARALQALLRSPVHEEMMSLARREADQLVALLRNEGSLVRRSMVANLNSAVRGALASCPQLPSVISGLQRAAIQRDPDRRIEHLRACLGSDAAQQLLQAMPLFASICQLLNKCGHPARALDLVERVMQVDGHIVGVTLWAQYVSALLTEGRTDDAECAIEHMKQMGHSMADLDPVLAVFVSHCAALSSVSFESAMERTGIKSALISHRARPDDADIGVGTVNAYLVAQCRFNRTVNAMQLYKHMKTHAVPLLATSRDAYIEMLVRQRKIAHLAELLVDDGDTRTATLLRMVDMIAADSSVGIDKPALLVQEIVRIKGQRGVDWVPPVSVVNAILHHVAMHRGKALRVRMANLRSVMQWASSVGVEFTPGTFKILDKFSAHVSGSMKR